MFPTYVQPPLEFNLVDSLGLPCRAKLWPSKRPCETFILFLPGNPGVISYYDEFLTALHHDSTSTTVLGISHVGHEDFYVSEPLSLQEQVDHKLRIVDSILSSFSSFTKDKPRFILMGHSVGAYMALQVLKQRPQNIDNLFLLFPTISDIYKGSMSAKLVAILTSIPYIAMIVAWHIFLIRLVVPIPLIALYLRLAHTLPGRSLSTTLAKFLNPATVQSFIHLGKCELQEIRTLDDDTLTKYASRITAYYALQDKWVPHDQRKLIMRILNDKGGDAFICNEGFPHAFSLVHGAQMAKKVSLWISSLYHPITTIGRMDEEDDDKLSDSGSLSLTVSDQEAETLVNLSDDTEGKADRKESLGGGVFVREQLIKDLQ